MAKKKNNRDDTPIIIIICFAIATVVLCMAVTTPNVKYEDLTTTYAVVDNFHVHHHTRTGDSAHLITEDGTEYRVNGHYYPEKETSAKLVKGTYVEIKYYKNNTLFNGNIKCAQEVSAWGEVVVSYENDFIPSVILMGFFILLFTLAGVALLRFYIKRLSKKKQRYMKNNDK